MDLLNLVGVLRDGAAVNGAALDKIHFNISTAVHILCHSHVIARIGDRFNAPLVEEYFSALSMLFAHSAAVRPFRIFLSHFFSYPLHKARSHFTNLCGHAWHSPTPTRWYSRIPGLRESLVNMAAIHQLLSHDNFSDTASALKILPILRDRKYDLILQLHTVVAYGSILASACYTLEGDGQVIFKAHDIYSNVEHSLGEGAGVLPSLIASLAGHIASFFPEESPAQRQERLQAAGNSVHDILRTVRIYLGQQRIKNQATLAFFELAKMFDPSSGIPPTADRLTVPRPLSLISSHCTDTCRPRSPLPQSPT